MDEEGWGGMRRDEEGVRREWGGCEEGVRRVNQKFLRRDEEGWGGLRRDEEGVRRVKSK